MDARALLHRYGDALLAALLAVGVTVELLRWSGDDLAGSLGAGLLATLPLVVRRRNPLVSYLLVMLGLQVLVHLEPGFDNDSMAFVVAFFVSLYSLGRHASGTEAWLGVVGVIVAMVSFIDGDGGFGQADPGDIAFVLVFVGAPWAAGLTLRLKRERETTLGAENERLRREQEVRAQRAVAEERSRIARELHDVVSHAISVTVLQARGARRTLDTDPEAARRALDAIEQTNTAALSDMRRLLAVLRDTEPEGVDGREDRAPQPSLEYLPQLVGQVRESGLPVELTVLGTPHSVPPGVDLSAYRIVQEALTNVLKHSKQSAARVLLEFGDDALGVTVSNDGSTVVNGHEDAGQGLIGIRERVAVVGGDVTVGPIDSGGFEVRARLPYSTELS